MQGIIVKHVRGIYYVDTQSKVVECKARGLFRKDDFRPIVGDVVDISISKEDGSGYILSVEKRRSYLKRPLVANIDHAFLVTSIKNPIINTYLIDKNLIMAEYYGIDISIIITKTDLVEDEEVRKYSDIYRSIGYEVFTIGTDNYDRLEDIKKIMTCKVSTLFGPSGVGKSTLINILTNSDFIKTNTTSSKTGRGRHTTRHVELYKISEKTYLLDTPGFSSLDLDFFKNEEQIREAFVEFKELSGKCKFLDCRHVNEPDCAVKSEVGKKVAMSRYDSYLMFLDEIKKYRRY